MTCCKKIIGILFVPSLPGGKKNSPVRQQGKYKMSIHAPCGFKKVLLEKKENLLPQGSNRFNLIRFFPFEECIQGADLPLVIFIGFYRVVAVEFLN